MTKTLCTCPCHQRLKLSFIEQCGHLETTFVTCLSSVEEHLTTCDNCVAITFEHECVLGLNDQRPILAKLEYVGWVENIQKIMGC